MRVLICGGREGCSPVLFANTMSELHKTYRFTVVITGMARGVDTQGAQWARDHGFQYIGYPANWTRDGKAAGPIRNQWMLNDSKPDLVIAFPGGRGTQDMVMKTMKAKVRLVQVKPDGSTTTIC